MVIIAEYSSVVKSFPKLFAKFDKKGEITDENSDLQSCGEQEFLFTAKRLFAAYQPDAFAGDDAHRIADGKSDIIRDASRRPKLASDHHFAAPREIVDGFYNFCVCAYDGPAARLMTGFMKDSRKNVHIRIPYAVRCIGCKRTDDRRYHYSTERHSCQHKSKIRE